MAWAFVPAARAADQTPVQMLLDEASAQAHIDPELTKREAESAIAQLKTQPDADLEIQARLLLCDYYTERDGNAAAEQGKAAMALLPSARRAGLRSGVLQCQGAAQEALGANAKARALYDQAVSVATETHDDAMLGGALLARGYLRSLNGEFAAGLNDLKRAEALFDQQHLPQQELDAIDSIAILYLRLGNYAESAQMFERELDALQRAGQHREEAITSYNIGRCREYLTQWSAAHAAYQSALEISNRIGYPRVEAYALRGLGSVAVAENKPERALALLTRARTLQQHVPDARLGAQIDLAEGQALRLLGRLKESVEVLERALGVFRQADSPGELAATYDELAYVRAELGDWGLAYENRSLAESTATRLLRNQLDQRFEVLKVEYDLEAQEKRNELLQRENQANMQALAQHQKANNLQTAVIILTGLLLAMLGVMYVHQRRTGSKLRGLAMSDELTGVPNRRAVLQILTQQLQRSPSPTSILIIDVDHFKSINDRFGHLVGDETLKVMASTLRDALSEPALVGRLGGEEFAAILPGTNLKEAQAVAERLRERVLWIDFSDWLGDRRITVSVGVATSALIGDTTASMLRRADAALYAAKDAGRNCVRADSEPLPEFNPRVA